jgi:hypothetical protein
MNGPDKRWQEKKWQRARLHALGFKRYEYDKYLETLHWKAFRKATFEAQRARLGYNCCEHCPKDKESGIDTKLLVHHLTCELLGNELPVDVVIICRDCHDEIHGRDAATVARHYAPGRHGEI